MESAGQLSFQAGANLNIVTISIADVLARASAVPGCRELRTQIQTLLDDSTVCSTDADCQVVYADIAMSSTSICDAYVNRSVSFASVEVLRTSWNQQCVAADGFSCTTSQVHPAICHAGRCEPLCPDAILPTCPATCSSIGHAVNQPCVPAAVGSCLSPDGQLCTCTGPGSTLVCAPQPLVPGCGIACTSTYPVTTGSSTADAAVVDVGVDLGMSGQ